MTEVLKQNEGKKFRFAIESVNKKISQPDQVEIVKKFGVLPFNNEFVDLKNFEIVYKILVNANDGRIFFGNRIACCRPDGGEDETYYAKYTLK